MTTEQLITKIKANPALAQNFRNFTIEHLICPCCVKRIVEFSDQKMVEAVVDTIIQCKSHAKEVEAKIQEATNELRQDLNQTNAKHRQAIRQLYEMFNSDIRLVGSLPHESDVRLVGESGVMAEEDDVLPLEEDQGVEEINLDDHIRQAEVQRQAQESYLFQFPPGKS